MYRTQKSATCCYCGTKSVLSLDEGHHELKCSTCGAPLKKLKQLRSDHVHDKYTVKRAKSSYSPKLEKKKRKKKKTLVHRLFDVAEDLIDILD